MIFQWRHNMVKNGDSFVQCFLSFRMLCVCQVFQYLEAQPPVSYIEHTFPPLAFSKLSRGYFKKLKEISFYERFLTNWCSNTSTKTWRKSKQKQILGNTTRWSEWQLQIGSTRKAAELWGRESLRRREIGFHCHHCHVFEITIAIIIANIFLLFTYIIIRLLRSYVMNNYDAHFREIFLAVLNEYTNWDQVRVTIILYKSLI